MKFLEYDLEEIIFKSDKDKLSEKGLFVQGKLMRQVRIGNYGIADLVEYRRDAFSIYITIYELKKDKISMSAFLQAVRYAKGIERYLTKKNNFNVVFKIVLIGKSLDFSSSLIYLPDLVYNSENEQMLEFYTYSYDLDGISFSEQSSYCLTKEGF